MLIYKSKFLNVFIGGMPFPIQSTLLVRDYGDDKFEPNTEEEYKDTMVYEDSSSIPTHWKMSNKTSIQINTLRNLAKRQQKIIAELIDKDVLVPSRTNVYSFYIDDCDNKAQDHERDELPYHCIYIVLGRWKDKRRMSKYLKSMLKGSDIHCIAESYNCAYKRRKGGK